MCAAVCAMSVRRMSDVSVRCLWDACVCVMYVRYVCAVCTMCLGCMRNGCALCLCDVEARVI